MRKFFLLSCFLSCSLLLWSQVGRRQVVPVANTTSLDGTSANLVVPFAEAAPFFTYFVEWPAGSLDLQIRFSEDGQHWTGWQTLRRDDHSVEKGSTLLYVGDPSYHYYQLEAAGEGRANANLHFFYPGASATVAVEPAAGEARDLLACPCPQPEYQNRAQWCPAGNCPIGGTPVTTAVTHLIVHHTAGPNDLTDWAAYMRAVWDFHVNGRGWDDIGYNWLIDPNGVIYQGRGDNIRGAHFCGTNTGTMGVAMMGDYTDREPTPAALTALRELLAWKSCDRDFDPLEAAFHASSGRNLRRVSGHRDGCSTSCPGDQFYPLFGQLRQGVADYIEGNCTFAGPLVLGSTAVDDSTYQLNWVYNGEATLDSFYLEKATGQDPVPFAAYQTLPAAVTNFTEADLDQDGIFRYRLRARTVAGDTTDYSNVLVINTTIVKSEYLPLAAEHIQVAPNPFTDQMTVWLQGDDAGEVELDLLDAAGLLLDRQRGHKAAGTWTSTYDWSHLPAGLYLLRIRVGERYGIQRIVKAR